MEMNSIPTGNLSMQEILRLANSPAGRQLVALLQQNNAGDFQAALANAASGDCAKAKRMIEAALADPQAQRLLKDLGR